MDNCRACNSEDRDRIEALGFEALEGRTSWRKAAADAGYSHHAGLKSHMENHFRRPQADDVEFEMNWSALVSPALEGLKAQMAVSPPELAALLAVAMHNLLGLQETKPSQANLVGALKAVNEVTGMKMEQRLLLEFSQAAHTAGFFKEAPKALEAGNPGYIDAEAVEEDE